ncbi:MAG TPA: hypothetical protein VNT27_07455, partial [Propionibacteriaceae bacterium]|nr:hypothetical protein [Propionibacteriaceae bacterium]
MLLESAVPGRLDERVRDRILAETRGNPVALLELPDGLTAAELAGGLVRAGRPAAGRPDRAELPAAHRVAAWLRPQRLLLVAAAEPVGDVPLLGRVVERLGMKMGAAAPAEAAGWSRSGRGCGSGTRWCARPPTGRRTRRTLGEQSRQAAEATDPGSDPDRRARRRGRAGGRRRSDPAAGMRWLWLTSSVKPKCPSGQQSSRDRPARQRGEDKPGDRRPALHQPAHGRVAP